VDLLAPAPLRIRRWAPVVGAAVAAAAFGVRGLLSLGDTYPYITAYPAVMAVGYWLGGTAGIAATAASVALGSRYQTLDLTSLSPDIVALLVFAASGTFISLVCESRLRALSAAQNAAREAEDATRARDVFLAAISHELRTPLTAIVGWASMLADPKYPRDRIPAGIETIRRNASLEKQLVEDLLDFARIINHQLPLALEAVDIGAIVDDAADTVRLLAAEKDIRLEIARPAHALTVNGDAGRLKQVMWNLLTNAIKFTPNGGSVRIDIAAVSRVVRIAVTDTGTGIDAQLLPHVFEAFRQGEQVYGTRSGAGLGLAIARSLVQAHGGSIQARSEGPGTGATFVVTLPVAGAAVAAP